MLPTVRLIAPFCGKLTRDQVYSSSTSVTGDTAVPNSCNLERGSSPHPSQ
jgi:hypothetical protein